MNNEEKILAMLEQMQGDISQLNQNVAKLEQMPHQIQLIAEAQAHQGDKLDKLQKSVDDMAGTVAALDVLHQMQPHE